MTITAAADGSSLGNPGPAGWAWYVDDDHWAAGGWPHGTNNMGELMAVLDLLRQTAGIDDDLRVLCDSQYVINAVTQWMPGWKRRGWKKADGKPVLNVDLLRDLDAALEERRVRFEWVKGHAGHELNEAADARARAAATAHRDGGLVDAGPGFGGAGAASPAVGAARAELPVRAQELVEEPDLFSIAPDESAGHAVTVRHATARDAAALYPLTLEFGTRGRPLTLSQFETRLAGALERGWVVFVAEIGGRAVGYAAAQDHGPGLRARWTEARLHDLYVQEHVRRRGVARQLMEAVAAWAAASEPPMILDWQSSPSAAGFYERLGYVPDRVGDIGEYPGFCIDGR